MAPSTSPRHSLVARANARVYGYANRYWWLGPLIFASATLYFYLQIVVAWAWHPPYSLVTNAISDLGNNACGPYRGAYVCSPRWLVMDITFVGLGLVMAVGSWFICQEFVERSSSQRLVAKIGFSLMAIAGVGTMLVGIFPENQIHFMHFIGAALAIGLGNVAIMILGVGLDLDESLKKSMIFGSVVSLTALVLFGTQHSFGIGAGTMERIAAYPESVWLIRFSLYLSKNHRTVSLKEHASRVRS